MKNLLLFIFLLVLNFAAKAQFPLTQNLASDSTLVRIGANSKGAIRGSLIPSTYTDTATANAGRIDDYPYAMIATSGDGNTWMRNSGATGWILMASGGSGGGATGSFWNLTGNTFAATPAGYGIGTNSADNLPFKTNSTTRVVLPSAGLERQVTTGAFKYMLFDTTNKTWGYGDGGSGSPAGNFGNIQINRNSAFDTPASDSLDYEAATGLSVKNRISLLNSTSTNGALYLNSSLFLSNFGADNTNVYLGFSTGSYNLSPQNKQNVAIGNDVFSGGLNSYGNVGIGHNVASNFAPDDSTSEIGNIFIGYESGANATGGSQNVFVGPTSGRDANSTSYSNVGIGKQALVNLTSGCCNAVVGANSGTTTGSWNAFMGGHIGQLATSAYQNAIIGGEAFATLTEGYNNASVGYHSGGAATTAVGNVFAGAYAGNGVTTGATNIMIGNFAGSGLGNVSNRLVIESGGGGGVTTAAIMGDLSSNKIGINMLENATLDSTFTVDGGIWGKQGVRFSGIPSGASTDSVMVVNASTGQVKYRNAASMAAGSVPISGLTAATATNTINNAAYQQEWQWNSLAGDIGLSLTSNSTAAVSSDQNLVFIGLSGANANSGQTTIGLTVSNTHTGTTSSNVAATFSASGGTNNYAITVPPSGGSVGIGTSTPTSLLHVNGVTQMGTAGSTLGQLLISGNTSGTVTIQPAAAAGTYTLTLPTSDGDADQFLQTNGSGVLTWATASGGSPAGNFGNIQINRNGAFATPGSDSLDFESASGLTVKGLINSSSYFTSVNGDNKIGDLGDSYVTIGASGNYGIKMKDNVGTVPFQLEFGYLNNPRIILNTVRMLEYQGTDVASAAGAITLTDGNTFEITGTAAITLISNVRWQNGSVIHLIFTSTATLTDGTANSGTDIGMELAGGANFTGSADDVVTLILSEVGGVQRFREVSRSVN